jgi:hypothetical protein
MDHLFLWFVYEIKTIGISVKDLEFKAITFYVLLIKKCENEN